MPKIPKIKEIQKYLYKIQILNPIIQFETFPIFLNFLFLNLRFQIQKFNNLKQYKFKYSKAREFQNTINQTLRKTRYFKFKNITNKI